MSRQNRGTSTHFPCGHERSAENSFTRQSSRSAECRACSRERNRQRHLDQFKCGHPKIPENCVPSGSNFRTCRTCKAARDQMHNRNNYAARRAREARAARGQVAVESEAIALYRTEKAKRAERLAQSPAMEAAKVELERQREAQAKAGRGGRPRGSKNGGNSLAGQLVSSGKPRIFAQRNDPLDLLPYLGEFHGRAS
jgi:hypothetical protein